MASKRKRLGRRGPKPKKVTIIHKGKRRTFDSLKELAHKFAINYITLYFRINNGMQLSKAVKTPVCKYRSRRKK